MGIFSKIFGSKSSDKYVMKNNGGSSTKFIKIKGNTSKFKKALSSKGIRFNFNDGVYEILDLIEDMIILDMLMDLGYDCDSEMHFDVSEYEDNSSEVISESVVSECSYKSCSSFDTNSSSVTTSSSYVPAESSYESETKSDSYSSGSDSYDSSSSDSGSDD